MKFFSRSALLLALVAGIIYADQSTKLAAQRNLHGNSSLSYFDGIFNFVYAENVGVMLGVGSALPEGARFIIFVVLVGLVLAAAAFYLLYKPLPVVSVLALSLVIGGGVSNIIDRLIRNGSVIDFMVIRVGSLESGIFNIADVFILIGICVLGFSYIGSKRRKATNAWRDQDRSF